jgi:hypothetical protein
MHLNNKVLETHLSTPISQTFALIAGDCNTTACGMMRHDTARQGPLTAVLC